MLTLALFAAFAAVASADVKFTCGDFSALTTGTGYSATGSVQLFETAEGIKVVGTDLHVKKDEVDADATYIAHVHATACDVNDASGHWKINTTETAVIESNELWIGPQDQTGATPWGNLEAQNAFKAGTFVGDTPSSLVIHEKLEGSAPKRVCCDFAPAATTTTAAAEGSSSTAAATTSGAQGNTTAAATTTAAADTNCANAADPAACCEALNELEQVEGEDFDPKLDACNMCVLNEGCKFYRNIGGSVAELTSECIPTDAEKSNVALTEVDNVDECDLKGKACDDLECEDCLAKEACVWCDTGAKIGFSTGSCTETKCTSGVDPSTECSSASVASVAALAVAAAAALKL